ncbi:MAG: C4-dicarboxylate ABC transporter substrate-binding protein, partial [Firmicutes bacterium]|nr:C4-dicarboxylate ABC transporter substrate-binding protein [Bacillota bacterium]
VICRADMYKELVYNIAKTLWENVAEMAEANKFFAEMKEQSYICNDTPIALHPGAEEFYKSVGGIK